MEMNGFNRQMVSIGCRCVVYAVMVMLSKGCATHVSASPEAEAQANRWSDDVFLVSTEAESAYRDGRWIDAVRHYETLTRRVPEDSYSWFRLGNAYARQGDYGRAVPAYEASLLRNSEQPKPWFNLSSAYLLNARIALQNAYNTLRPSDPARGMIAERLKVLESLLHGRFEDDLAAHMSFRQ